MDKQASKQLVSAWVPAAALHQDLCEQGHVEQVSLHC